MDKIGCNWKMITGVGCTCLVSAGVGYLIARLLDRKTAPTKKPTLSKSSDPDDPVMLYVVEHCNVSPVLKELNDLSCTHAHGTMTSTVEQDVFLTILTKSINAKKALDIGMFYGCSALSLALGLADEGKVVGFEISSKYIENGKPFFIKAGVNDKIDVRIKDAEVGLAELIKSGESGTYDIAFLDAFKERYAYYIEPICTLLRPGGLLVVDNVLWRERVVDPQCDTAEVKGIRKLNDDLKNDPRFEVVILKMVDGITIARKV